MVAILVEQDSLSPGRFISKYSGRTLGQVLREDPHAILWVANKFGGDPEISAAAKLICEQAMEQSA